jgi:hypothetical protein
MTTLVDYGYFICGLYSFILILIGTPLNLICFYIFKRLIPNRSNATIIVFSYLALIEVFIPFTWNLNYAIRELIWKHNKNISIRNLEQYSIFVCKLVSYGAYFLLQCAAWLKTLATFARCVSLHHEWAIRKYLLKPTMIHRISWIIILLTSLINIPVWIINGTYVDSINQTRKEIKCYHSRFFHFWEIVHLLLYNFIPFTLMILCNILIIRHVDKSRRRTQRQKIRSHSLVKPSSRIFAPNRRSLSYNDGRLTKTLILITIFFILFTSPSAIFYISLGKIIKRHRNLITMSLSNLATTSHVLSFVIYWLTSTDFRDAIFSFLCYRSFFPQQQIIDDNQQEKRNSFQPPLTSIPASSSENQRTMPLLQIPQTFE